MLKMTMPTIPETMQRAGSTYYIWYGVMYSVSCQFSDNGLHNQLSSEQKQSESEQKWSISEKTRLFAWNIPWRKLLVTRESYTDR